MTRDRTRTTPTARASYVKDPELPDYPAYVRGLWSYV